MRVEKNGRTDPQNRNSSKPPFYKTALLFPLDRLIYQHGHASRFLFRRIIHLICVLRKYLLSDFFRECFGPFKRNNRKNAQDPPPPLKSHIANVLGGHRLDEWSDLAVVYCCQRDFGNCVWDRECKIVKNGRWNIFRQLNRVNIFWKHFGAFFFSRFTFAWALTAHTPQIRGGKIYTAQKIWGWIVKKRLSYWGAVVQPPPRGGPWKRSLLRLPRDIEVYIYIYIYIYYYLVPYAFLSGYVCCCVVMLFCFAIHIRGHGCSTGPAKSWTNLLGSQCFVWQDERVLRHWGGSRGGGVLEPLGTTVPWGDSPREGRAAHGPLHPAVKSPLGIC